MMHTIIFRKLKVSIYTWKHGRLSFNYLDKAQHINEVLYSMDVEIRISLFVTFSTKLRLSCDYPVVTGGGNQSTRRKPPPNHKSLATFSRALGVHGYVWSSKICFA